MTRPELCTFLKKVTRRVLIDDGKNIVSAGSGVVIDARGTVLTAKHVVASGNSLYPGQCLVSSQPDGNPKLYRVEPRSLISLDIGQPQVMRPMDIDLALLHPAEQLKVRDFASLREEIPQEGTDVMMAGFSDDVLLPFHFEEHLETRNLDTAVAKKAIDERFKYFMRQLLCRRAMIGLTTNVQVNQIHAATYVLDAELTYGGSGGPVLDYDGALLAIVVRKGLTSARKFMIQMLGADTLQKLPSTTGYALSHHLLLKLMK